MHFPKPESDKQYLNGIIRNSKVITKTNGRYKTNYSDKHIIGNDYGKIWISLNDSSYKQYAQLICLDYYVEVSSYLFTGNNTVFITKSWDLECSSDGSIWEIIDSHKNEPKMTILTPIHIFDTKKISQM